MPIRRRNSWQLEHILDERMSARVCHEFILRDLQLLQIPPEDAPSYETVRSWLRQMPAALTLYARQGKKAYRDQANPYLTRAFTDVYANDVWVGDVQIFDIEAQNDVFENVEYGVRRASASTPMLTTVRAPWLGSAFAGKGAAAVWPRR